jgi:serine/threonine protein kinase
MKVLDKRKYINAQAGNGGNMVKYAKQEQITLVTAIGNPYICQLKESFQNDKNWFLVLEYCPCGDLRRVLNKSRDNKL